MLRVQNLSKSFTLYLQGGVNLPVFDGITFAVEPGTCTVLAGSSGIGKSTLLRLIYGNYKALAGKILIHHEDYWVDLTSETPQTIYAVRARTMGYVSQFLRCLPRVAAIDVVAEPLLELGYQQEEARRQAGHHLERLNIADRLFDLPPATFSGGEQQRVNIARGFIHPYPLLLLDEPTASLDAANRSVVVEMINEAKGRGAAILGIFHDADVRQAVADRYIDVNQLRTAA